MSKPDGTPETSDQFGANTGREVAYAPNIGAGEAGTEGATGNAPANPGGPGKQPGADASDGKASGGEEVVAGKSGIRGEQAG